MVENAPVNICHYHNPRLSGRVVHSYWGSLYGLRKISLSINLFIKALLAASQCNQASQPHKAHPVASLFFIPPGLWMSSLKGLRYITSVIFIHSALLLPRKILIFHLRVFWLRQHHMAAEIRPCNSSCVVEAPADLLSCHFRDKSESPVLQPTQSGTKLDTIVLAILRLTQLSFLCPAPLWFK